MSGANKPIKKKSSTSFSDDSDSGISNNKKPKIDIKAILKSDDFQSNWINTVAVKELFEDIQKISYDDSIQKFKEKINISKAFKKLFSENAKFNARLLISGNEIYLRLDISINVQEKTKCAHFYNQLSKEYSEFIDVSTIHKNQCSTCSLKKDTKDNIIVVSEHIIAYKTTDEQQQHADVTDGAEKMDTTSNDNPDNPEFAELANNNNTARTEDNTMVSIPTNVYNSLLQIAEQYKQMKQEFDELKKTLAMASNSSSASSSSCNVPISSSKTATQKLNSSNDFTAPETADNQQTVPKSSSKTTTQNVNTNNDFPVLKTAGNHQSKNTQITQFKKNKAIPPILVNVDKYNQQELMAKIKSAEIDTNCMKFFPAANNQIRIQINDINIYDKVHALLKSDEISLFTHAIKDRVKPIYIIKNLCKNFALNDIKEDLNNQNFEILEIARFETKFHTENNIDSKMVKVTLPENTDTKAFEKIRFILHMRVYIQTLKPSKILQCKRCQRLHHSANYCNFPYRCVKCTEKHDPGQCKLNAPGNTCKPKCCNCGGEHIASSYKCKYLATEIEKRGEKKTQDNKKMYNNNNPTTTVQSQKITATKSYANVAGSNSQRKTSKTDILNNLKSCMLAMQQTIELLIMENE